MTPMPHINIEIKATCKDSGRIREKLKALGAKYIGLDHQIDTCFNVSKGRLKLREGNIENTLIYYQRPNEPSPKRSDVSLFKTENGSQLKDILTAAVGMRTVVDKKREIFFIDNVKFHLDSVDGLGEFVEIEAIDADGLIGAEKLRAQCAHYMELFGIKEEDLVSNSYGDMPF